MGGLGAPDTRRALVAPIGAEWMRELSTQKEQLAGWEVTACTTLQYALELLESCAWDALVIEVPVSVRPEEVEALASVGHGASAVVPVIAHPDADGVARWFRAGVADVIIGAQRGAQLIEVLKRLPRKHPENERILAIGAHPDDVEIGIGGSLAAHQAGGDEVTILTLTRGGKGGDPAKREQEAQRAAETLGARLVLGDLPDTELRSAGAAVELIEHVVQEVMPTIAYVHSAHDTHQDHRNAHLAARVGTRRVARLFAYQSPSSTTDFRPTRYNIIDQTLSVKITAIAQYRSQTHIRPYLAEDMLTATARYWSRYSNCLYAEPVETVRDYVLLSHSESLGAEIESAISSSRN